MPYYRVDKRIFEVGDTIPPTPNNKPNSKTEEIESLLDRNKPNDKPHRLSILKVFDNKAIARDFWVTCSNSVLYEVEIEESGILHIADYELLEKIYKEKNEQRISSMAQEYWNGMSLTDERKKEIFVSSARVISIIGDYREQREEQFKKIGVNLDDFKMSKGK